MTYRDEGENYCATCVRWRWLIAYRRCRECFDNWLNQREGK